MSEKKKVKCPNPECDQDIEQPMKEWDMRPSRPGLQAIHVKHYRCPKCNRVFRIADKIQGPVEQVTETVLNVSGRTNQ
jgi:hypothetical protein